MFEQIKPTQISLSNKPCSLPIELSAQIPQVLCTLGKDPKMYMFIGDTCNDSMKQILY